MVRGILGIVLAAFCAVALAQDALLDRARRLIQVKQYKEAYALLEPQEQARAGDPQFDYLLGVAAIDSGQLTRGVFALERVLAVNPNNAQARAEIARAYFLMGENKTARNEFQAVKAAQPPAEVAATVDRFLDALDARDRSRHTGVTGYAELAVGHDSNVSSATSATGFAVPAFPGFVFNGNEDSDWYWQLNAGLSGRYGVTDRVGLIGSASIERKTNFDNQQFDTGTINGSAGVSIRDAGNELVFALQAQTFEIENDRFRDAVGGVAQYRHTMSPNDQVTVYGQYTRLTYPDQSQRDADRYVAGAAWAHAYTGRSGSPVMYTGLYAGKEDPESDGVPFFGHRLAGLRLGGQMGIAEKWILLATANYEYRRYGGQDPFFGVARRDKELQLRVATVYQMNRHWSLTPALTWTHVQSNVLVFDYDRRLASLTARYDFR
jgi:tetratricopeptide (TPR) repeat protein